MFVLLFFQGPTHRLEIHPAKDLLITDLSTDEEERVHGKMKNYEKKIDHLMSEVGSLKNEVLGFYIIIIINNSIYFYFCSLT